MSTWVSFIVKNTDYEGGITRILKEYGFDVSDDLKDHQGGLAVIGSQTSSCTRISMADRMDYLIRDSHFTGIKYGPV